MRGLFLFRKMICATGEGFRVAGGQPQICGHALGNGEFIVHRVTLIVPIGADEVVGGNIIIPIDISTDATTISITTNGI